MPRSDRKENLLHTQSENQLTFTDGIIHKFIRNRIFGLLNSYTSGKSGGDVVFAEIFKRINFINTTIITSQNGREFCESLGVKAKFMIITKEQEFRNIYLTYAKRIVKTLLIKVDLREKDIFIAGSDFLTEVIPLLLFKIKCRKIIWVQHVFHIIPSSRFIPHLLQKVSFFIIKKFADIVTTDNLLLKNDLVNIGFNRDRVHVNYPGLDHNHLKSFKASEVEYEGIFMAQLRKSKGLIDLILIWEKVCKKFPNAKLGIIGKGTVKISEEIKKEIRALHMEENIDLLGFLQDESAFPIIKASKIFLFPSHEEGFGIAPLEAQALGVPVVAYDLPVFKEIFPYGMVKVRFKDIQAFANETIKLLTNTAYRENMSSHAILNASQFNWNKTTDRESELIKKYL